jgi:hypothetical protein
MVILRAKYTASLFRQSWTKLVETQCNIHDIKIYSVAMSIKLWIYFDVTPTPPVQCC